MLQQQMAGSTSHGARTTGYDHADAAPHASGLVAPAPEPQHDYSLRPRAGRRFSSGMATHGHSPVPPS